MRVGRGVEIRRTRLRWPLAALGCVVFLSALVPGFWSPAGAQTTEPPQPRYGWREVWAGADATRDVWLLYSGVTLAPWSADVYSDGLRLRTTGGYGQYHYRATTLESVDCGFPKPACKQIAKRYDVDFSYNDALVGYHQRFGELTAKAFIGLAMISHDISERRLVKAAQGREIGVKGVIELWLNLGPHAWTSLDLAYTTAHKTSAARWRAGWRILPTVSIGPEGRYDSNFEDDGGRAGLFARYEWFGGEASVAAGWSSAIVGGEAQDPAPYATVNVLMQY